MENSTQKKELNSFGEKLKKILEEKELRIEDLSDTYPVSDEDVYVNLYVREIPDKEFIEVLIDKVHITKEIIAKLIRGEGVLRKTG
jgi:hypothetical protein